MTMDARPMHSLDEDRGDDELDDEPDQEEDVSGSPEQMKPWDPTKIRITTKSFSLREAATQIQDNELDLAPDFQRAFVWKERQRTRLVESILLGIPLPAFYFNQDKDGAFQVVDGVQRLSTVKYFIANEHTLLAGDLEYLKDLEGATYSKLDAGLRRRFANTMIIAHIIEPQTPDEVKYDIFSRVNTGGSPLTAQELRHCMSRTKSRDFLRRLVELGSFERATEGRFWVRDASNQWVRDNRRMADRELALRFCAFRSMSSIDEDYQPFESLDAFLLDFTRRIDGRTSRGAVLSDGDLERIEQDFDRAMTNCHAALGKVAFRRWPAGVARRGPINRAVFEAHALAMADLPVDVVSAHREAIQKVLRGAFSDPDYLTAVTVSTGDRKRVEYRLRRTHELVRSVLS
jgi:hypothetical protein